MMLRTVYNQLVVDPIKLDTLSLQKYYNDRIEQFSTNPYRKIRTFGFETEAEAKKMRKKVSKLLKKNDEEGIKQLISESSEYKSKDGVINHIYKNDIIPGIGKDEVYNSNVWKAKPQKLSKIFQNSKDIWTFFYVMEDVKAVATPFEDIVEKVKRQKLNEESRQNFEQTKAELASSYNLKKYPERMIVILSAEEYFNKAEAAQKKRRFTDAIYYYDKIIENYANNVDDYKATFMKGFLYSEELADKESARECFVSVIEDYPQSELHESCLLYTSPSPRDRTRSRMPSSA